MRKTVLAASLAAAAAFPGLAAAQQPAAAASPHTVTGNLGFVSDYRFRGISQTFQQPAIQGGIDYSHSGGAYLGTWASNVQGTLTNGPGYAGGNMEWDIYGGYKWEVAKDLTLDVGGLYYWYPDARYAVATKDKYDNFELYIGAAWKWLAVKYSVTTTDYFGTKTATYGGYCGFTSAGVAATTNCASANPGGSKGSGYLDVTGTFEVGDKLNLIAHVGQQKVKNYGRFDYTDYKLGLAKEWAGFTWGASLIGTNADKNWWRAVKTEGGGGSTSTSVKDPGEAAIVLSVGKTF